MAKSKHPRKRPPKPIRYDPRETDAALSEDLRVALKSALTLQQLITMEAQLRKAVENATERAVESAVEEAYKRFTACIFRVLRDRFGFGKQRLRKLFDSIMEYMEDVEAGRLTTQEMLDCLKTEDGIESTWNVHF